MGVRAEGGRESEPEADAEPDVAEKIARLEALIARVSAA